MNSVKPRPMVRQRAIEQYRLSPGKGWSKPDETGRRTCLRCSGNGTFAFNGLECKSCDGEGYRWDDPVMSERRER